jgi:hypothetical protein
MIRTEIISLQTISSTVPHFPRGKELGTALPFIGAHG